MGKRTLSVTLDMMPIEYHFQVGGNPNHLAKKLGLDLGIDKAYRAATDGLTLPVGPVVLVWVKNKGDAGTMAHEIYHAVVHSMEYTGIDDEEFGAYLTGHLMSKVNSLLD